jgi:hypothetical protein
MSMRFCAMLGFIVLAGSGPAFSQTQAPGAPPAKRYPWDQRQPKCFVPGAERAWQCKLNDWPDYRETLSRAQRLLLNADLDLVLRAESDLGFSQKKFPTGQYYFEAWYSAMETMLSTPNPRIYALVEQWGKAKGEEGYARIAEALLKHGEAWQARGSGYASAVSPESWDIYRRKLREADQALDSASKQTKNLGPWYALKLKIAYQLPELAAAQAKLLAAGTDLWPDYAPLYAVAMGFSLPKWGGTYERVDKIARMAYDKSKNHSGASLYPMTYRIIFAITCDCTIADTVVDWDLMKRGFRDIEKQAGGDADIWKGYAAFACQMRDRQEARRLLELSDKLREDRTAAPPDPCREFAFSST